MTTRKQIIAQIEVEITRLERVRDLLEAALKDARKGSKAVPLRFRAAALPTKKRKPVLPTPVAASKVQQPPAVIEAAPAPAKEEPAVKRLPPKRRMERRHVAEKLSKSGAALSGAVPAGPVVVSATEARKVQERAVPAAPPPPVIELRPETPGERSLGSLIQAFERRAGISGLETP
jgi:hypothetical protein